MTADRRGVTCRPGIVPGEDQKAVPSQGIGREVVPRDVMISVQTVDGHFCGQVPHDE